MGDKMLLMLELWAEFIYDIYTGDRVVSYRLFVYVYVGLCVYQRPIQ